MGGSFICGVDYSACAQRAARVARGLSRKLGRSLAPQSRGGDISYDALMRWEWEGGTPAPAIERNKAARAEPATNTRAEPQPRQGRLRVATAPPLSSEGWQGDGSER
jgi:hypothetical protein